MQNSHWCSLSRRVSSLICIVSTSVFCGGLASTMAQTTINGSITSDQTWDLAGSPYTVQSMTVAAGIILTIEPGVTVRITDFTSPVVHGTIRAAGTAGAKILFTSASGAATGNPWGGLRLTNAQGNGGQEPNLFRYCEFEGGGHWFRCMVEASSGAEVGIDQCVFRTGPESGVRYYEGSGGDLSDCLFEGLGGYGIWLQGTSPQVTRATFRDCGNAMRLESGASTGSAFPVLTACAFEGDDRIHLAGHILSSGLLMKAPYYLDAGTGVVSADVELTIAAGATFHVADFASWTIHGNVIAGGTAAEPILFTSVSGVEDGDPWGAVRLTNNEGAGEGRESRFAYCTFEGGGHWFNTLVEAYGGAPFVFDHCTFQLSRVHGLRLRGVSPDVTGCTFRANAGDAVRLESTQNGGASFPRFQETVFEGDSRVHLYGEMHSSGTLTAAPYFISGGTGTVQIGVELRVDPGVTFYVDDFSSWTIFGNLVAAGAADAPIRFTSVSGVDAGNPWGALRLIAGSGRPCQLTHCVFEGGGYWFDAMVDVDGAVPATLSDCIFTHSGTYGLRLRSASPELNRCRFAENGNAIRLDSDAERGASYPVISESVFEGDDRIHIWGDIHSSGTLSQGPYLLNGSTGAVGAAVELTVEPGTQFSIEDFYSWDVKGNLIAQGTVEWPIVFTSLSGANAGNAWGAVRLTNDNGNGSGRTSRLDHCLFEGGGYWFDTLLKVSGGAPTRLHACTFRHSIGDGVRFDSGSGGPVSQTIFSDNAGHGLRLESSSPSIEGCSFQRNVNGAIALLSTLGGGGSFPVYAGNSYGQNDKVEIASTIHSSGILRHPGAPYLVRATREILRESQVEVAVGVTVEFEDFAGLVVRGTLTALGTASNPIVFTSDDALKERGQWAGVVFSGDRPLASRLQHCRIEAGGYWYGALIEVSGNAEVQLQECLMRLCSGDGVQLLADSTATLSSCLISDCAGSGIHTTNTGATIEGCDVFANGDHGVYAASSAVSIMRSFLRDNTKSGLRVEGLAAPSVTDSVISGNDDYGIHNTGSGTVKAPNNWWGDSSGPFHGTLNPEGLGNRVSDRVEFQPYRVLAQEIPQVAAATLQNGVPLFGTFSADPGAVYYAVEVSAGQHLMFTFDDANDLGITQVYLSRGRFPTASDYQVRHETNEADQRLFIPLAGPGTWYILVHQFTAEATSSYTVRADMAEVVLNDVTPTRHAGNVLVTMTLSGVGFAPGTSVELISGTDTYTATTAEVDSGDRITATFAPGTLPPARYDVRVRVPGKTPAVLADAFEAVAGGRPHLVTNLVVPGQVGYHQLATVYVEYSNQGEVAMPAPILIITAFQAGAQRGLLTLDRDRLTAGFWTSGIPEGFSNSVPLFATGDVPGVLQPGESKQVPVYYAGWQQPWDFTYPPIEFAVSTLSADDGRPIDWEVMRDSLLPNNLPESAFDIVMENYREGVGETVGDFVSALSENAAYLGRLGHTVTDVDVLNAFEFLQAEGLAPLPFLSEVLDAELASTTRLPLTFVRFYPVALSQRLREGDLGLGWVHNWSYQLTEMADGTVEIRLPRAIRRFQPDSRGGYFSSPGDQGMLTRTGAGSFTLSDPDGLQYAFVDGRLIFIEERNGVRITAVHEGGKLRRLDHSNGRSLRFDYDAAGRITALTDAFDRRTTFRYDGRHLAEVARPNGATMTVTYFDAAAGAKSLSLKSVSEGSGRNRYFEYDTRGRLSETGLSGGLEPTRYSYGGTGAVTVSNALNQTNVYHFDHHGEPARLDNAMGGSVLLLRNRFGRLEEMFDAYGYRTRYEYDTDGRLRSITNPVGAERMFTYDSAGKMVRLRDPLGFTKEFAYDAQGNIRKVFHPDGTARELDYNSSGEVTELVNGRGQQITYSYDAQGNMTRKLYPDGSTYDYHYDGNDRLIRVTDPTGQTNQEYDSQDRLKKITFPDDRFREYNYDEYDRRTSIKDQDGREITYHYDEVGRLAGLRDGDGQPLVDYTFDAAGQVTRETFSDGRVNTYAYNESGLVIAETRTEAEEDGILKANGTVTIETSYDLNGRPVAMNTSDGLWEMSYDPVGRLTDASLVSVPGSDPLTFHYEYDLRDRYVSTTSDGMVTPYVSNPSGLYTQAGDVTYTYDGDGNRISRRSGDRANIDYSYDPENRVTTVLTPSSSWSGTYDGMGFLTLFEENGTPTFLSHDVVAPSTLSQEYDAGGDLLSWHVHGIGLQPIVVDPDSFLAGASPPRVEPPVLRALQHNGYQVNAAGDPIIPSRRSELRAARPEPDVTELLTNPAANQFSNWLGIGVDSSILATMRLRRFAAFPSRFRMDPKIIVGFAGNTLRVAATYGTAGFTVAGGSYEMYQGYREGGAEGENKIYHGAGWTVLGVAGVAAAAGATVLATPVLVAAVLATSIDLASEAGLLERLYIWGAGLNVEGGPYQTHPSQARDPNQKTGPAGIGEAHYVAPGSLLPYRVEFENDKDATAPAQVVMVTDPLDSSLDWSSFTLTEIGFGDHFIAVPPGTQNFETTKTILDQDRYLDVSIVVSLDPKTGMIRAIFSTSDPTTGLPPEVNYGFLPPEDGTGRGQGYFDYVIRPKSDLATGTVIRNIATIVFDFGEIIRTNQVDPHDPGQGTDPSKEAPVTIDAAAPVSSVADLSATSATTFTVAWSGNDAESGVGRYSVFVRDRGAEFEPWLMDVAVTSAAFTGLNGQTYEFYAIATDRVGNEEPAKMIAEASTTVGGVDLYAAWVEAFFTATEIQEGQVTRRDADPDSDGRANLDEFVFVTHPREPDMPEMAVDHDETRFALTWTRRKAGLVFVVEESADLRQWSAAAGTQEQVLETGEDFERIRTSIPTVGTRMGYVRIRGTP